MGFTDRLHQTFTPNSHQIHTTTHETFSIEIWKTARQVSSAEVAMQEKLATVIFQIEERRVFVSKG